MCNVNFYFFLALKKVNFVENEVTEINLVDFLEVESGPTLNQGECFILF